MARKLRIEYPGACYHVINRGNFRQEIFNQPGAAQSFEKVLFETIQKFNWKLSAYVIMSNHFHLAIQVKGVKEKKAALERARQEGVRLNEVQELRETVWEEILQEHAHNLKINLNELGSKKSSLNKLKLAYVMKQKSDVTNLWLTTQMDMGHPATVSQSVKRFSQAQGKEVEKLNAYLSKSKM